MMATIVGAPAGSKIRFAMWMREVGPPKTDYPRVYPPPNVLICGVDKTWRSVNEELAAIAEAEMTRAPYRGATGAPPALRPA